MKINYYKLRTSTLLLAVTLTGFTVASAVMIPTSSEVTGTLSTGLGNSSVTGIVIAAPVATPGTGTYTSTQTVALTAAGSLSIHYTVDGTTATCTTGNTYSAPITVASSQTIRAISCYANSVSGGVSSHVYTIATVVSGGGGGGGGISTPVVIATTTTIAVTTSLKPGCTTTAGFSVTTGQSCAGGSTGPVGMVLGASTFNFTTDLKIGSRGTDVIELQKILIAGGFLNVEATGYFGTLTATALTKWQAKNGLTVSQTFGNASRAFLNATQSGGDQTPVKKKVYMFAKDLRLGNRNNDVTELQKILIAEKFLNVGAPTNYFGIMTQTALKKWQAKNGLKTSGYLDTASRAFLKTQ